MEIQCSNSTGDTQCCEEETTHEPFCCGGEISKDLIDDFNQATKILSQIFYTLAWHSLLIVKTNKSFRTVFARSAKYASLFADKKRPIQSNDDSICRS